MTVRTTEEVFEDHLQRRLADDIEGDIRHNFSEACVLLTGEGIFMGRDGVRRSAALLKERLVGPRYKYRTRLVAGEIAFLEWTADSENAHVYDGADSFCIRGGQIVAMTIHYTVAPRSTEH